MKKLHPRAVWIFFCESFILSFLFSCYIFSMIFGISGQRAITSLFKEFMIVALLSFIFSYIWAQLKYSSWRYELTENAIRIEKGVITKKYISIPYQRVQNVDIYRGIVARIFKLSDLHVQTAGYSGGYGKSGKGGTEGKLPGLDIQVAEQLREGLIGRVSGTKQGL